MKEKTLVLQNLSKYYYTDSSVTLALRKVNLEFAAGEFVAVTGESGSGKSTLLNILSGIDTSYEGEVFFEGESTFAFDREEWEDFRRDKIGFIFQDYSLIGHYSARENIVSALLIMGIGEQEAKKRAEEYLEKVGLKGFGDQRASELSSGQKQRLSIARALAKNTPVIMADEPTGNLDSETGEQIVRLLKELSEDRLIIMVTHNYEQAAPYVTRKVRLHDGEVVVDVRVNEEESESRTSGQQKPEAVSSPKTDSAKGRQTKKGRKATSEKKKTAETAFKKQQKKTARRFARLNRKTSPGRAFVFRLFFFFTAVVSFIFIGELFMNADDVRTKKYDRQIFYQKNDSRLSVKRKDGKAITDEDMEKLKGIRNVVFADRYDYANDINYYMEEGKDYKLEIGFADDDENISLEAVSAYRDKETPRFLKKNKFVHSVSGLSESDLKSGHMPENRYEIVVTAETGLKTGDTMEIYFTSENIWGSEEYYHHTFTVSGITDKKDFAESPALLIKGDEAKNKQVYFAEELCHMLSAAEDGDRIHIEYSYDSRYGYTASDNFHLVIGDFEDGELPETEDGDTPIGKGLASVNYIPPKDKLYNEAPVEIKFSSTDPEQIILNVNKSKKGSLPGSLSELDGKKQLIEISGEEFCHQSGGLIEVPKELFDLFYPRESTQASVYIKNYTKTDRVLKALEKQGFEGISTFRISSVSYSENKVMNRLTFLGISVGILLVLLFVEVMILRQIMKLKLSDFFVLRSMGMKLENMRRISLYEMTGYCAEAVAFCGILMILLYLMGVRMLQDMMIYYGVLCTGAYILYNFLLEFLTVFAFNRLLKGRVKE